MKLTKEQTDNYVADPFHCPHCGSDEIVAEDFDTEIYEINVRCVSCKFIWREVFELKTIKAYV